MWAHVPPPSTATALRWQWKRLVFSGLNKFSRFVGYHNGLLMCIPPLRQPQQHCYLMSFHFIWLLLFDQLSCLVYRALYSRFSAPCCTWAMWSSLRTSTPRCAWLCVGCLCVCVCVCVCVFYNSPALLVLCTTRCPRLFCFGLFVCFFVLSAVGSTFLDPICHTPRLTNNIKFCCSHKGILVWNICLFMYLIVSLS